MITVGILLPDHWYQRPRYHLIEPLEIAGYKIPAGFETDGATVPRVFWPLFPPVDRYLPAAIVHDYLLTTTDRRTADRAFLRVMAELGICGWRRWPMFIAVRGYSRWLAARQKIR